MNAQLKEIRKTMRPFEELVKDRNYLTLGHELSNAQIIDQVRSEYDSLCIADLWKLNTPYRRPRNVVLAGHSLLSAIEIALAKRG